MKSKYSKPKKILSLIIAGFLSLSAVACKTSQTSNNSSENEDNKKLKIGVIQFAEHESLDNCHTGFVEGLKARGYEDGKNIAIDLQVAQADTALTNQIAQNFASKGYDLIVGIATSAAQAAYNAGQKAGIPIIFNAVTDPIAAGLQNADKSNKPGVTGTSDILPIKNQLTMIRAFQPEAKKIGILYTLSESNSLASIKTYEALAPEFGFEIVTQSITSAADVSAAAQSLVAKVDAITNLTDNTVVQNMQVILARTEAANLPYYGSEEEQVTNGCTAAEGLDYIALGKLTGGMAADIFDGKKAEEIPIVYGETSTPYINSKALEALGLELPEAYKAAQDLAGE